MLPNGHVECGTKDGGNVRSDDEEKLLLVYIWM